MSSGEPERWADTSPNSDDHIEVNVVINPPVRDAQRGVMDTACRISVAGNVWYQDYRNKLVDLDLSEYITEKEEKERYRFGDGGVVNSFMHTTVPIVMCGRPLLATCYVIPSENLGLLLGRDFLDDQKADISVWKKEN